MLCGLVMALVMLEMGLRLITPTWLKQRMGELNVGAPDQRGTDRAWPIVLEGTVFRQFVPHSSFTVSHYEYQHTVTTDELGGRTTPYRADYASFVPFMGDSFTLGVGVEDTETFVSLLAAQFAPPGSRWLNLGVTGTALHNQLDTLAFRHDELGRPERYVFCLFMGNDLTNIRRHYQRSAPDASSPSESGGRRWLWRANVFVFHHPALKRLYSIQFLRQKLLSIMNRGDRGFMQPVFLAMRNDLTYLEDSMVFLRQELARLTELSRRLSFEATFILIPDVHQIDATRRAGKITSLGLDPAVLDAEQIARSISRTLDQLHIPHLDIGPCLAEAVTDELYYTQDNHFTAAGHAWAARCIHDSGHLQSFLAASLAPSIDGAS